MGGDIYNRSRLASDAGALSLFQQWGLGGSSAALGSSRQRAQVIAATAAAAGNVLCRDFSCVAGVWLLNSFFENISMYL